MSCYNEEKGTYTLPAGEYNRMKRELKVFWDKTMDDGYKAAVKFYEYAVAHDPKVEVERLYNTSGLSAAMATILDIDVLKAGKNGRWKKPLKKDMAKFKAAALFKANNCFEMDDATLTFNDQARTVTWCVSENNHAVGDARKTPLATFFFRFLASVKWRGRTGGCIAYMDEYMSDDGPCEPSYRDKYGYAVQDEEERIKLMLKRMKARR